MARGDNTELIIIVVLTLIGLGIFLGLFFGLVVPSIDHWTKYSCTIADFSIDYDGRCDKVLININSSPAKNIWLAATSEQIYPAIDRYACGKNSTIINQVFTCWATSDFFSSSTSSYDLRHSLCVADSKPPRNLDADLNIGLGLGLGLGLGGFFMLPCIVFLIFTVISGILRVLCKINPIGNPNCLFASIIMFIIGFAIFSGIFFGVAYPAFDEFTQTRCNITSFTTISGALHKRCGTINVLIVGSSNIYSASPDKFSPALPTDACDTNALIGQIRTCYYRLKSHTSGVCGASFPSYDIKSLYIQDSVPADDSGDFSLGLGLSLGLGIPFMLPCFIYVFCCYWRPKPNQLAPEETNGFVVSTQDAP